MIRTLLSFAWAVLTLLLAASCTDRADDPAGYLPTGKGNVRLNLPGIVFADESAGSRTDADEATEDERAVTSLWFMVYPIDGNGTQLVQELHPSDNELIHEYESFDITLAHGEYQVYVVANVDGINTHTSEDALKQMLLSYSADNLPSTEGGLPMAYKHDKTITVDQASENQVMLQADLVFCCSKVRYTLIFDNTAEGSEFGDNYLTIQKVTGRNFATQTPVIPRKSFTLEEYFDTNDGALNGKYIAGTYTEGSEMTFDKDAPEDNTNWAYRGSFYVPENLNADNTKTSNMAITANLFTADGTPASALEYTINLGGDENVSNPNESETPLALPRGMYYDIVAEINSLGELVIISAEIQEWTPVVVEAELESPYHLWVEETVVGTFEIPLESGDVIQMGCRTDAPVLEYESVKFEGDTDLFDVDFQQKEGKYTGLTIRINPEIKPTDANNSIVSNMSDKCIWVRIEDPEAEGQYLLSKKIEVKSVSLEPYLIVTPPRYDIYISELSGLREHTVTFTYETNLDNVTVSCGESTVLQSGIQWNRNRNITLTDSGMTNGVGTVTVTLNNLENALSAYANAQTINLDYTADGDGTTLEEQTLVNIIPNAQKYRLHFRPVTDDWVNPHIYVYQPLFAPDGKEIRIPDQNTTTNEFSHALRYSFTGKRTFLGWRSQGGTIDDPGTGTSATDFTNMGSYWQIQRQADNGTAWEANDADAHYVYDFNIDYCSDFRQSSPCPTCSQGSVNTLWPGVAMKADEDNPGWFYFDLPALAEPGITLIMFAEEHTGPLQYEGESNDAYRERVKKLRYPPHLIPGVPLYDYADKDGWFLYDYTKGDYNEFVDDKPDIADLRYYKYRIYINTSYSGTIHVWEEGGTIFTTWGSGVINTDGDGKKYFEFQVKSPENKKIGYKFTENDNSDHFIEVNSWTQVTGKDYDYEYTIN